MAPSRGTLNPKIESHDEIAVEQQSRTALANARRNFNYLLDPTKAASSSGAPSRLRTRAFLRTFRYVTQFIFWRLVRWAKYAAVGALVAAVSATAFGGFVSGIGWLAAPPTIGASVLMASVWGVGKFAARRLHARWKTTGMDKGEVQREFQEDNPLKRDGTMGTELGPEGVPW